MENNKTKNTVSLIITSTVALIGIALVIIFFIILKMPPIASNSSDSTVKLNKDFYQKLTSKASTEEPLVVQNEDVGRTNPFDNIK